MDVERDSLFHWDLNESDGEIMGGDAPFTKIRFCIPNAELGTFPYCSAKYIHACEI